MTPDNLSRRQFLGHAAVAAGALTLGPVAAGQQAPAPAAGAAPASVAAKRLASDLVPLGSTGLKISRLGVGLGSSNGEAQARGGQEGFNKFIKHAFDQGITFLDTAQNYRTYRMVGPAIKGLPRDKLFLQSKIGQPADMLNAIDAQRKVFDTDYVDSMLVHIQVRENWTETWKRAMEDFDTAVQKKWILSKGVSCHSLPALRTSIKSDWTQVHLVRVNPQGIRIDNEQQVSWTNGVNDIAPVLAELKKMKEKGRGVIGMKIFGNGEFTTEADREKSLKFAMSLPEIDCVTIGFAGIEQLDAGIKLMNKVLGELG